MTNQEHSFAYNQAKGLILNYAGRIAAEPKMSFSELDQCIIGINDARKIMRKELKKEQPKP